MSIIITSAVVHELVKEHLKPLNPSQQIRTMALLDCENSLVINLANRIHESYGNQQNSCTHGVFRNDSRGGKFPQIYDQYVSSTTVDFLSLTHGFLDCLIDLASQTHAASGGYIVCLEYRSQGEEFVTFAMIKKSNEIQFNKNLEPIEVTISDLKKLHQAIRFNKSHYRLRENNTVTQYLSFLSADPDGASKYFVEAAGCEKGFTSRTATSAVYGYFESQFCSHEKFQNDKLAIKEALTKFFDQKHNMGLEATISDIVAMVNTEFGNRFAQIEQAEKIVFFEHVSTEMNGDKYRIPASFPVSIKVVEGKRQFKYKSDFIDLKIDLSTIDKYDSSATIYWDRDNKKLILTDSKLEAALEKQLYELDESDERIDT